jgi:hypothetical protein
MVASVPLVLTFVKSTGRDTNVRTGTLERGRYAARDIRLWSIVKCDKRKRRSAVLADLRPAGTSLKENNNRLMVPVKVPKCRLG